MEERFEEILTKIGLTVPESRTYLGLLKLKESQTGQLCKLTGIASSNIYKVLDSLVERGLAGYKLKNNVKVFMASPPEILKELFVERERKLREEEKEVADMIKNLKKPNDAPAPYANYKYFEGISGAKAMWLEFADYDSKDDYAVAKIYSQKKEAYGAIVGFYDECHKVYGKLGRRYKIILPFEDEALGKKRKKVGKGFEIKYADFKNEAEWGVRGDKLYIQTTTGKLPVSFLINNAKIAKTFEQVFDDAWRHAKK
ncbi:hypothetical protein HOA55_02000 [archaeon]|jgi:sugar-specific transcriptional regulator TrmB|nr:hypothetical protein [archaeon]MBT7025385.1 hypothetical protein [archaeon]MBT7568156.1 hypothetical protein [archaeon]MBT7705972.1 hypothetical protein [archaeon]